MLERALSSMDIETEFAISELIAILNGHLTAHRDDYRKAMIVYQKDIQKSLKDSAKAASKLSVAEDVSADEFLKPFLESTMAVSRLTKPVNQTKMYEGIIDLLEKSTKDTVVLSFGEAHKIIHDEWDWAVTAKFANAMYSSRI